MKKLSSASVIALALAFSAGSALAADLPSRKGPPPYYLPPPAPLWSGFYVGLNAGYGWGTDPNVSVATTQAYDFFRTRGFDFWCKHFYDLRAPFSAVSASGTANVQDSGFIGGGQIGYNFQWAGRWIIGFEADIQGADIRGENSFLGSNPWTVVTIAPKYEAQAFRFQFGRSATTFTDVSKHTDWLGTVRGRLGFLLTPTLLVYGTGGLAYGGVAASVHQFQTINSSLSLGGYTAAFPATAFGITRYNSTRVGWSAGGGVEWMFMPSWSLKLEALYYDLGSVTFANSPLVSVLPTINGQGGARAFRGTINQGVTRARFDGVIARAGVNLHFNWGAAPVVARF